MAKTVAKVLGGFFLLAIIAALPLGFSVGSSEVVSGVPVRWSPKFRQVAKRESRS
jgi:ABC-type nitrate/sulfonate/bicarbonate transport system permease component